MEEKTLKEKLAYIQKNLKAPKNQYNAFGKYHYRSCEDILEAIKPYLDELLLTIEDDIILIGDRYYVKAIVTLRDCITSDYFQVIAYAREELDKKGMDVSQITGAASSYARKYALNGLFLIDDTKDADAQRVEDDKKIKNDSTDTVPIETKKDNQVENKYLTFEELKEKMRTAKNIFELNNRCKKYRPDYDQLSNEEKVSIQMERDKRKVWLVSGEGNYTDIETKAINKEKKG